MNAIELAKTLDMPREQCLELRKKGEVNDGRIVTVAREPKRKRKTA